MNIKQNTLAALLVLGIGMSGCDNNDNNLISQIVNKKTEQNKATDNNKTEGNRTINPNPEETRTITDPNPEENNITNSDTNDSINNSVTKSNFNNANSGIDHIIEDIAGNADGRAVTAAEINGIDGVSRAINGVDYTAALQAGTFADKTKPTAAEIQTVVDVANAAAVADAAKAKAIGKITTYASDDTKLAPNVQDYLNAGVTGVTADNLDRVNGALHITAIGGGAVNSTSAIQGIVNNMPTLFSKYLTITAPTLTATLVSMFDNNHGVNVGGSIASNGLLVKVPYHADRSVTLNSFTSPHFTIDAGNTSNNESGVVVAFHWSNATLPAGDGYFDAKIVPVNGSNIYYARQLDITANGYIAATLSYPTDKDFTMGRLDLKVIPAIPDRSFNAQTNGVYEHRFLYLPVTNPITGRTWLNNNLGAEYANMNSSAFNPTQQATASNDYKAYGSLFQWGRKADGHELINWTGGTAGAGKYGTTSTKADDPSGSFYIIEANAQHDWRVNRDDTLWASESSPNNVCPVGYRLPLNPNEANDGENEWYVETNTWSTKNMDGALTSNLKLVRVGIHDGTNGTISGNSGLGGYWTGSAYGVNAHTMDFNSNKVRTNNVIFNYRVDGNYVRCIKQFTMEENASLPANITIDNPSLEANVVSIHDQTPYGSAIDIQGIIDSGSNPLILSIPYTVSNEATTLPAYSKTYTIATADTEDGVADIVATFSWSEQLSLAVGSGTFNATITTNVTYNAKKLDIEDDEAGKVVATFNYPTDSTGSTGTATLKVLPGILDRNFNVQTNNKYEHRFVYTPVTNPITGRTWLSNNLGAEYANINSSAFNPTRQATAINDYKAYGSLFQWGRKADGHELINWTSGAAGAGKYGTTSTKPGRYGQISTEADNPSDSLFITTPSADWRVNRDNTLWASESSANNVCPTGYRLPLNPNEAKDANNELYQESKTWSSQDRTGALSSGLKLTAAGFRKYNDGIVYYEGINGDYWTGSVHRDDAHGMAFNSNMVNTNSYYYRARGFSVRCIKD